MPEPSKTMVLVYQMGKVGSTAITQAVESLHLGIPVYHLHFLNDLDAVEQSIRRSWFMSEAQLHHLEHCRQIRKQIDNQSEQQHCYVITLIRDPVARNISGFFYNLNLSKPELFEKFSTGKRSISQLHDIFFESVNFDDGSQWFDQQLKPVFGIDVFNEIYPKPNGYKIYRKDNVSILLIKLEHLNTCGQHAFKEFLDIDDFEVISANRSEDTHYYEILKRFQETVQFPEDYLRKAYATRIAQHFYSTQEIEQFKTRWLNSQPSGFRRIGQKLSNLFDRQD